jgi:hypothetical protein
VLGARPLRRPERAPLKTVHPGKFPPTMSRRICGTRGSSIVASAETHPRFSKSDSTGADISCIRGEIARSSPTFAIRRSEYRRRWRMSGSPPSSFLLGQSVVRINARSCSTATRRGRDEKFSRRSSLFSRAHQLCYDFGQYCLAEDRDGETTR